MHENENHYIEKELLPIINVKKATCVNNYFRRELWTGEHAQITVMSIPAGGEIGLEIHDNLDQILVIEYGIASVYTGKTKNSVTFKGCANNECAVVISANTYHNILNEQSLPLKLFSVYAPPKHPVGTIHKTKFESDLADY
ncbi:MAG: cupin domain-containing protein [Clostridia bacterium]|nr:cupin domain-containing protein [Clostridia bacterium]